MKLRNFKYLILSFYCVFLIIFSNENSFSQAENLGLPFIRNFTTEDYNFDSQNWSIVQDDRGIMYFANSSGILEYDGKKWTQLNMPNNLGVNSLSKDSAGTIFIGGTNEFGYLAASEKGSLIYVSLLDKLPENYKDSTFNDVVNIFCTTHGTYFITPDKVFRLYNNSITLIEAHLKPLYGSLANDRVFITQSDLNVYTLNETHNKFEILPFTEEEINSSGINLVLPFSETKVMIITKKKGFYIYDFEILDSKNQYTDEEIKSKILIKFEAEIFDYVKKNIFYKAIKYNDQYIFGTIYGGIIIMDENGKIVRIINENRGLLDNTVLNIFADNNMNLWAALNEGISFIELNSPISFFDKLIGLDGFILSTINFNGTIYAGCLNGIYYLPDYKISTNDDKYNFKPLTNDLIGVAESDCWDFSVIDNKLFGWFGASVGNIHDSVFTKLDMCGGVYCSAENDLFKDVIIGGLIDGLMFITIDSKSENIELEVSYLPEITDPIKDIVTDKNNDLWVSTQYNGILHFHFTNPQNIKDYTYERLDSASGLTTLELNYIYKINDKIVICNQDGIFNPVTENGKTKIIPAPEFQEWFSKDSITISSLTIDKNNQIWITGGFAVYKLNFDGEKYSSEKIKSHKFPNISNIYADSLNIIWISTVKGLFRYDLNVNIENKNTFSTFIRKVKVMKDSVIFNGIFYDIESKNNNIYTEFLTAQSKNSIPKIKYDFNTFHFEFSASSYESLNTQYKYFLEGFDNEWSDWTTETTKEYTNIPEGTYNFRVIAKNDYETESSEAKFKFIVQPPWYRTFLAYLMYTFLGLGLIYLIIKINSARLVLKNKQLEILVKNRTAEINQQKEELRAQSEELAKLSIVASETDNAITIMDSDGNFEWINLGFTRLYGYNFEEFIKAKGSNIISASSYPAIKEILKRCKETGKSVSYESKYISKLNNTIWAQTTVTPIFSHENKIIKLIAIDSDISKLKQAENEILQRNEEIMAQKEEILVQRDELEDKNNRIEMQNKQITGSITYAKSIQQTILPSTDDLDKNFECFILYRPKDIVSGDFYWYSEIKNENSTKNFYFIAVVDCTGHGVPGAFMSMIGNRMLNEIVNEKKIFYPSDILDALEESIIKALKQEKSNNMDGMDISICRIENIDNQNYELKFSGAKSSLYFFSTIKNEIEIIPGDRKTIGGYQIKKNGFTTKELPAKKGDMLYLSSDGIIDQNNVQRKRFGTQKFVQALNQISKFDLNTQKVELEKTLDEWKFNVEQRDDITVVGIKI